MKNVKKDIWLLPGEICIARGNSTAKNLMFESKKDHKLFLKLWDKYLGGMTEVLNYHLSPDTWTILFKAKSMEEIVITYNEQRSKSSKAKLKCTLKEPKRMLSEHIRIFLSQYVRKLNANLGRKGSLVMERFRKCIIKSHSDYEYIFNLITNQVRFENQKIEKYRADERQYDIEEEMNKESIWQVGKAYYDGNINYKKVLSCMRLLPPKSYVLRKYFDSYKLFKPPPIF